MISSRRVASLLNQLLALFEKFTLEFFFFVIQQSKPSPWLLFLFFCKCNYHSRCCHLRCELRVEMSKLLSLLLLFAREWFYCTPSFSSDSRLWWWWLRWWCAIIRDLTRKCLSSCSFLFLRRCEVNFLRWVFVLVSSFQMHFFSMPAPSPSLQWLSSTR